jgi:hypothetical protein
VITDAELAELERDVQTALRSGDPGGLHLLGEGEISLVLAGGGDPTWACKRLPPFAASESAAAYTSMIERYIAELTDRGIRVLDTSVRRLDGPEGGVVLYCVQPVLSPEHLAVGIAARDATAGLEMLDSIVGTVLDSVDHSLGLDAQLSNWAMVEGRLVYLDITTPLLRRPDGTSMLDTDVFLASLPWALRGIVRRWFVPSIIERYHDPRTVVLDLAANLLKDDLDALVPRLVELTAGRVEPPLSVDEVRRDRRSDEATWTALQATRRVDRAWQRRIRRRPYPFLLPNHRWS